MPSLHSNQEEPTMDQAHCSTYNAPPVARLQHTDPAEASCSYAAHMQARGPVVFNECPSVTLGTHPSLNTILPPSSLPRPLSCFSGPQSTQLFTAVCRIFDRTVIHGASCIIVLKTSRLLLRSGSHSDLDSSGYNTVEFNFSYEAERC